MTERIDLYTTIHKGLRSLLFEAIAAAARLDLGSSESADLLLSRVEELLEFLEEHAEHEDRHVLPTLRTVAPELEASLAAEHRTLDLLQLEVAAALASFASADPSLRPAAVGELCRSLNQLAAAHLAHMHREETEAMRALWNALDDAELAAVQGRIIGSIAPVRMSQWMELVLPTLNSLERAMMAARAQQAPAAPAA